MVWSGDEVVWSGMMWSGDEVVGSWAESYGLGMTWCL